MTQILWTAAEVAIATSGELVGENAWKATGIAMDSRAVVAGDLFIAMDGEQADGHDYVAKAFENGAVAAIVSREIEGAGEQVVVKNTFESLQDLGQVARHRAPLQKVIAITGSVGKTGVRNMLDVAFDAQDLRVHASIKSYNNHVGVPFSLATMNASSDIGVFEVGMNHADEITPLSRQIAPDIAIVTWVAGVHIENFDNGMDGIVAAKSEIFEGMNAQGVAILPRDNDHYAPMIAHAKTAGVSRVYSFGETDGADAKLMECLLAANGTRVKANIMGEDISYTLQIAGKHIAINSLSTLLAVKLSKGNIQKAAKALEKIEPIEGRGRRELIDSGEANNPITLIDESYNASPVAMNASFKVMAMVDPGRGGRRIAVLGDMLELGARAKNEHENLAMPLQAAGVDLLYCSGQNMKALYDKMSPANQGAHRDTSAELAEIVPDALVPGDVVLVKGSFGSKMKTIVEAMRALPQRKNENAL
ncbi:MAG: UDP-N-acetylmuramoylalanyl-D-glutamyl-2, 6-diaminopimelate--D-alanyl-D-alanine ligase [Alphaproteobacteria bacterium]|nr:MAG: UDP-N-acetylmuramoylalanyl-D-glutamyl-2, 6-diaminopimelate--D-alanyl-D-alanine ligase [Alphaproteobacteria bacterium]